MRTVALNVNDCPVVSALSLTEGDSTIKSGLPDGGGVPTVVPNWLANAMKSENPVSPSPSRSNRASNAASPRCVPNLLANAIKSEKPTVPSPSKSGDGVALKLISLVVVSSSCDALLSASVTDSMPMENSRPVTSATVSNSARARNAGRRQRTGR